MRLGIFGGTFDPVHYGHLLLAESCREQLGLDEVWFLPAAVPPHKQQHQLTPGATRIEMLDLAIGGHEAFRVSPYEVERGGVNYTVDSLAHFREERAPGELFFLLGADSLRDLPTWREPARICELAVLAVVGRTIPGVEETEYVDFATLEGLLPPERLEMIRRHQVSMPRVDLSSREIRRRVAAGQSILYQTPRAVEKYIESTGLYRTPATSSVG